MKKNTLKVLSRLLETIALTIVLTLFTVAATAQTQVAGKVTDSKDGSPLSGVTVAVKGTKVSTQTAADGTFKITSQAAASATLVFTSIGFVKQEVTATSGEANVSMVASNQQLNEVVVVGYGTSRKKDLTGAVNKISEKDLNQGAITNPLQQIAGKAPGVVITQAGSDPNSAPSVRIRGINSLQGGNDPLVVIDGLQGGLELLQQISPNDIDSYDILRDASSSAIYGSRGAGGVILITTKKGKAGKMSLEYNGVLSYEKIAKKFDLMNGNQYRDFLKSQNITTSDNGANTDWVDVVTRAGISQNHTISMTGGTSDFSYRATLTGILARGILEKSSSENYIGKFLATQKGLNDRLTLQYGVNIWSTKGNYIETGTALYNAYNRRPTDPVYNTSGGYFTDLASTFSYLNPLEVIERTQNLGQKNGYFTSLKADLKIIDGLTAGFFGSYKRRNDVYGFYQPSDLTGTNGQTYNGYGVRNTDVANERLMDLSLTYKKKIGIHSIDVLGLYEWQRGTYEGFKNIGRNFISDFTSYNALNLSDINKAQQGDISSYKNENTLISFLGRVNYTLLDKYLVTVSVRRDGSSKLGSNNKWGMFPSAAIGWRISQEDFLKDSKIINDLKIRLSYGQTGNQGGIDPYQSLELINRTGPNSFGFIRNANKDLRWEVKKMFNAGIDFSLINNKLTGSLDAYDGKTENMLYYYQVPVPPNLVNVLLANVGTMSNRGIELALNYKLIQKKDFTLSVGGNIAKNENKITELSGTINGQKLVTDSISWGSYSIGVGPGEASYLIKGQPVGEFLLYKHAGVDANGNQVLADLNKDGVITEGPRSGDRYNAGSPQPKFTYAFTGNLTYKNWDASILFRGVQGNKIFSGAQAGFNHLPNVIKGNGLVDAKSNAFNLALGPSDYWLQDGSFLRLDNLNIGYKVPVGSSKYISSLRLSFTGSNLFVITKYKGLDPEIRADGGGGFGIDGTDFYPRTRNFAFGVNVIFK
jgi:iron complex outermembrane receptor protein